MSERKCSHCGVAVPESGFITLCPACGQSLQAPAQSPALAAPTPEAAKPEPASEDLVCPSCRAPNAAKSKRCWQCHGPLAAPPSEPAAPSSAERESLDLGRLFADALGTIRPGEDLDEALLRAAKGSSPQHWKDLFTVALQMLSQATGAGEDREAAAARLARDQIDVEISSSREESHIQMGDEPPEGTQVRLPVALNDRSPDA